MSKKLGTLLIVDDEKYITNMVTILMREKTDNTLQAANGIEALAIIKENEIHCILSDIKMPKMNGVDLIKEIRKQGKQIPFIFYTGYGSQKLMMEAFKCGAFDFIEKPELKGLESIVLKGLQHGLKLVSSEEESERLGINDRGFDEEAFKTEYQKLVSGAKSARD